MFSTFWILYLTSYVGTVFADDDEASKAYANLMLCSVTVAIAFSPLIGIITDRVSPRITLPCAFLFRAIAIGLFHFIDDPTHPLAYIVGTLMVLGTTAEQICSDCILMRNAEREIRGVIYGTACAFGYGGQLILCLVGGWLFDNVSPQAPFMFVGALDLVFAVTVTILGATGVIKNDIRARKAQAEEIAAKRHKIETDLQTEVTAVDTKEQNIYSINANLDE